MNTEQHIIPELRFPGFDEPWVAARVGDVMSFGITNSFSRDDLNYESGQVKNIHYGDIHTKFQTHFDVTNERVPYINTDIDNQKIKDKSYCTEGDLIFADASEDLNDIGKSIEIVNLNNEKAVSGLHTILARPTPELFVVGFLGHLFRCEPIKRQIQKESQGTKVLSISTTRLSNVIIHYPLSIIHSQKEQQKIAACLSSLDEVVAAHSEKLEALKAHKKGLMQNLFPQEGETVPKFRFPEFAQDEEWVKKKLGDVFLTFSGGTPSTSEKEYYGGSIPFIRSAEISKSSTELYLTNQGLENSSAKMVTEGDLLVALYGANSGDVAISQINGAINQAILCLRSEFSNAYVCHFLSFRKDWIISRFIQGGQGNLSGDIIKSIEVPFPSKAEQQKIALFLSALDAAISAQTEKIDQLKQHKQGLMQGLFPKVNN